MGYLCENEVDIDPDGDQNERWQGPEWELKCILSSQHESPCGCKDQCSHSSSQDGRDKPRHDDCCSNKHVRLHFPKSYADAGIQTCIIMTHTIIGMLTTLWAQHNVERTQSCEWSNEYIEHNYWALQDRQGHLLEFRAISQFDLGGRIYLTYPKCHTDLMQHVEH